MILAVTGGVAVQLEVTSVGSQLRSERADMAGSAGLTGLDRERWNSQRRFRDHCCRKQRQRDEQRAHRGL
jgi:hypothetical protein